MIKTVATALIYVVYIILLAAHKALCWLSGQPDYTGGRWS